MARAVQVVPAGSVPRLLVVVVPEVTMMVAALSRVGLYLWWICSHRAFIYFLRVVVPLGLLCKFAILLSLPYKYKRRGVHIGCWRNRTRVVEMIVCLIVGRWE